MNAYPKAPPRPSTKCNRLVRALRTELQEYGGLLRLLNMEQDAILSAPSRCDVTGVAIERQYMTAVEASAVRRTCMGSRRGVGLTDEETIASAPRAIRPLLSALLHEIGSVSGRVQVLAAQNAWLRERAAARSAPSSGLHAVCS